MKRKLSDFTRDLMADLRDAKASEADRAKQAEARRMAARQGR